MPDDPLQLDPNACVTASKLVRNFGAWQARAALQPVFVMRRGQPSLVLTSFELMRRLCSANATGSDAEADQALLLDAMREAVVAIDLDGDITHTNRAARLTFAIGEAAARGRPLARLLPPAIAQFLIEHAARARRNGTAEHADIAIDARHFAIVVAPHPAGALLIFDDTTLDASAESLAAATAAFDEAMLAAGGVAALRLNLRGYIDSPSPSLTALTGLPPSVLASVRFVTLLDIASRTRAGEAIEATVREGASGGLTARLVRHDGRSLPVRIGLAPERSRMAIDAVAALLVVTDPAVAATG